MDKIELIEKHEKEVQALFSRLLDVMGEMESLKAAMRDYRDSLKSQSIEEMQRILKEGKR